MKSYVCGSCANYSKCSIPSALHLLAKAVTEQVDELVMQKAEYALQNTVALHCKNAVIVKHGKGGE